MTQTFTGTTTFDGNIVGSATVAPVTTASANLFDMHARNWASGGSANSQWASLFARCYTDSGQTSVGQINGILTAFYHSHAITVPYWAGIETGAVFLDNSSAVLSEGYSLRLNGPQVLAGGSVAKWAHALIPYLDATANNISNPYAILSESNFKSQFNGTGGIELTNTSGGNARIATSGNALTIAPGSNGTEFYDGGGNLTFTVPGSGYIVVNGIGRAGASGPTTNGAFRFASTSYYSGGDRGWTIANNQTTGAIGFYASTSATTIPDLTQPAKFLIETDGQTSPVSTVSQLGAATAGKRAFVSDSTSAMTGGIGSAVSGGGNNTVPVYADGTVWRIG